jgi:glutaredoxin 3
MKNFAVYSKDGCPYCDKIQKVLEMTNQNHVVYKLGVDFDREQFYNEFGRGSTFPRVICNEQLLGGCTETIQWLKEQQVI